MQSEVVTRKEFNFPSLRLSAQVEEIELFSGAKRFNIDLNIYSAALADDWIPIIANDCNRVA
jgi:hypothetical protein